MTSPFRGTDWATSQTEELFMKWVLIIVLIVVAVFLAQKFMAGRR